MRAHRKKKKLTHWILIIYSTILIVSMLIVLFISDNPKLSKADNNLFSVENELLAGEYDEVDEQYKTKEYRFDYEADTLKITTQYPESAQFILEEKQEYDQKVDVTIFGPYAHIDKYDVSNQLKTFQAELKDNELSFSMSSDNFLDVNIITTNFTSNQFLKETNYIERDFTYTLPIIYIQFPPNIEINHGPELNVRTVSQ